LNIENYTSAFSLQTSYIIHPTSYILHQPSAFSLQTSLVRHYTYSVHLHDKIVPYPPALLRLYPHTKALPFTDIDTERHNVSRQYFPFSANGF